MQPDITFAGLSPVTKELVGEISRQSVALYEAQRAIAARDAEIERLRARVAALEAAL